MIRSLFAIIRYLTSKLIITMSRRVVEDRYAFAIGACRSSDSSIRIYSLFSVLSRDLILPPKSRTKSGGTSETTVRKQSKFISNYLGRYILFFYCLSGHKLNSKWVALNWRAVFTNIFGYL